MSHINASEIKRETKGLIRNTYKNFTFNIKAVIYFELLYRLISTFLFVPINMFLINNFMGQMGVVSITNTDLLKFGTTSKGIIYSFLLVVVSFIAIFIEMSVLTYIGYKSHKKERVTLLEACINSLKILPQTFNRGMIFIVLVAGVIGPVTGVGLYSSLIKSLTIPPFITLELFKTTGGKVFYALIMVILVVLLLRWILSIPAVIIEKVKLNKAIKNSIKIYKENRFKIFGYLVAWILTLSLISGTVLFIYTAVGLYIIELIGETSLLSGIFMVGSVLVFYIGYIIASLISIPLFISFLIELYYGYRNYNVEEREFSSIEVFEKNKVVQFLYSKKKIIRVVSLTVFIAMVTSMGAKVVFFKVVEKETLVTAHRGNSVKAPENSISSVQYAISDKADYAEIDVMTTKDNKVVLFHDSTLKRIDKTNRAIMDMTFEETQKVDNGSYFSSQFAGERIPSLDEILKIAKGRIKLNIELKPFGKEDTLAEEVVKLVQENDMEDEVVITSLDYDYLQTVRKYTMNIDIGYILMAAVGDISKLDVDFISVEISVLKPKLLYAMHALGKEVHVWTINDYESLEHVLGIGVDNIITDNVVLVEQVKKDIKENRDSNYITMFYEAINSIVKYVKI